MPSLSVAAITWNSADRLEGWITRAREYADEVVLLVDDSSTDATVDIACQYADRVQLVEHPPFIEVYSDLMLRLATGDWILRLDDDEVMNADFAESKQALLDDRQLTHYYVPRRWVIRDADETDRWLATFPWLPNPELRLIRNVGSVYSHRGRLHSPYDVLGEGRVTTPDEAVIYHLDLAWRTRAQREAKAARYHVQNAPSCQEYYLYEEYASTFTALPVPEPLERELSTAAQEATARRRAAPPCQPVEPPGRLDVERTRISGFWDSTPVFAADYAGSTTPSDVKANRGYAVEVTLRNTSPVPWRTSGLERGRIMLGYHWLSREHGMVLRDGDRALLPHRVQAGETVTVCAGLWTPYEPGEYVLQWDLVSEQVNWFSERGVEPLSVPVSVQIEDRQLVRHRTVAELPPPAQPLPPRRERPAVRRLRSRAAPLARRAGARMWRALPSAERARLLAALGRAGAPEVSAGNVVPFGPARVLDTRDGTGVVGAPTGPIKPGQPVTLRLAGQAGIPDYAVGVVATVAVPDADYAGYLNVVPGDGPPSGVVSGYFTAGVPAAFSVVAPLEDGLLTMTPSAGDGGGVQLLVDVSAYLTAVDAR